MSKIIKCFALVALVFVFCLCKKKTDIKFIAYNPINSTYKADVNIKIYKWEYEHVGSFFGKRIWVDKGLVTNKITNSDGIAFFDDLKLERGDKVKYSFVAVAPSLSLNLEYVNEYIKVGKQNVFNIQADW